MSDGFGLSVEAWHALGEREPTEVEGRELLDGEPVFVPKPSIAHEACISRVADVLGAALRGGARIAIKPRVRLDERSEPRPDLAVLAPESGGESSVPTAGEVLLLVEVADSSVSLTYDRGRKAAYYARSGIPECWIVDLVAKQILVHRSPASGGYRDIRNISSTSSVSMGDTDGVRIAVADIVGS